MIEEKYRDTIKRLQPIAKAFIEKHKLIYPIKDTLNILSSLGYYIISAPAPNNLSGFYMKKENYPFIFVNSTHSLGRQNFSLWHEVYHHYIGHKNGISDFDFNTLEEREAEIFAGLILLPDKEIEKIMFKNPQIDENTIAQISDTYRISFQATVVRLMQYEVIDYTTYKEYALLSGTEKVEELNELYENNCLSTDILRSTQTVRISQNIPKLLERNFEQELISGESINSFTEMIGALDYDRTIR